VNHAKALELPGWVLDEHRRVVADDLEEISCAGSARVKHAGLDADVIWSASELTHEPVDSSGRTTLTRGVYVEMAHDLTGAQVHGYVQQANGVGDANRPCQQPGLF